MLCTKIFRQYLMYINIRLQCEEVTYTSRQNICEEVVKNAARIVVTNNA